MFPPKADNAKPGGQKQGGPGNFPLQGQSITAIAKPGERPPLLNPNIPLNPPKPGSGNFPKPTLTLSAFNECQQCHKQREKEMIYTDVICGEGCIVCKYCYANGIDQRRMECPRCHRAWNSEEREIIGVYKMTLP
jgi:hypothetical protein